MRYMRLKGVKDDEKGTTYQVVVVDEDGLTISDHTDVELAAEAAARVAHEADTTAVHGIADTSQLVTQAVANATYAPKLNLQGTVSPDSAELSLHSALMASPPHPYAHSEVTHPSVVHVDGGWNGYDYWMAITPLDDSGNSAEENPCIFASHDGDTWVVPPGGSNPIDAYPGGTTYNADTELLIVDDVMYCFYTENNSSSNFYRVNYRTSSDGVNWTAEVVSMQTTLSVENRLSPCVRVLDGTWHLWALDSIPSPNVIKHWTATAPNATWTLDGTCTIYPALPTGREPWHMEVDRWGDEWHMLLADGSSGGGNASDLYFLTAANGKDWTRGKESLTHRITPWARQHYRSSMVPVGRSGQYGYDCWVNVYGENATSIIRRLVRGKLDFIPGRPTRRERRATALAAGRVPIAPYLAADTFRRADGAIGNADSGQAWTALTGAPIISSNVATIASDATTRAVLDTGAADCFVEVEIGAWETGGNGSVIFRATNNSNMWLFGWDSGLRIRKVSGGSNTDTVMPSNQIALALTDEPVRLGVLGRGNVITFYINGTQVGNPITDAFNNTATQHGFALSKAATKVKGIYMQQVT